MNNQYEINNNGSQEYYQPPYYPKQPQQQPKLPVQQMIIPLDQRDRMKQSNEMAKSSFQKNIERSMSMNNQILSHRMSNMSSYGQSNTPQYDEPIPMDNMIESDFAPLVNSGLQRQPQINNTRGCECSQGQTYCGACQICSLPGHRRFHPGQNKTKGQWCDSHFEREQRIAMKKNPSEFISYQASDPMHPERPPMTINPAKRMIANKIPEPANGGDKGHNYNTLGQHKTPFLIEKPPQHHQDRQPQQINQQSGPNMNNFVSDNNSFSLNRTTIRSDTLMPREKIDYVGFNAQGEKIHDNNYYKQTPGRTNEHDYYREYKKYNQSGDYQPSNQSIIQDQYRTYQGNIPPKRIKLTTESITPNNQQSHQFNNQFNNRSNNQFNNRLNNQRN